MTAIAELETLAKSNTRDTTLLTEVGGNALWAAAFEGADPDLIDPAASLLTMAVEIEDESNPEYHSYDWYEAKNHLAYLALYKTVADRNVFTGDQLWATNQQLSEILGVLRPELHEDSEYAPLAQIVYQMLLNRRDGEHAPFDPDHVAFQAPPFAARYDTWSRHNGPVRPWCNVFVTDADGVPVNTRPPIPTQVRPKFNNPLRGFYQRYPGAHFVNLGKVLGYGIRLNLPLTHDELSQGIARTAGFLNMLDWAAETLQTEAEGGTLPDEVGGYLSDEGEHQVRLLLEASPDAAGPPHGRPDGTP